MFNCSNCGIEVTRPGLCYLCVARIVEREAELTLGNPRCLVCGDHLSGETVVRYWRSKGKVVEATIHAKCELRASFKRTYSKCDPRKQPRPMDWNSRKSQYESEKERMKLEKKNDPRAFVYFAKGEHGSYIVGRLVKSYMQQPNEHRDKSQLVLDIETAVEAYGGVHKLTIACTDGAVTRLAEDYLKGPSSIVGSYIAALYVTDSDKYKDISVFANKDFATLMTEVKESEAFANLRATFPDFDVLPRTVIRGIEEKAAKALGLHKETGDNIPF